jgi:serine/threonine-protein kinase RIO1
VGPKEDEPRSEKLRTKTSDTIRYEAFLAGYRIQRAYVIAMDVEECREEDRRYDVKPFEQLVTPFPDRSQTCEAQPTERNECSDTRPVVCTERTLAGDSRKGMEKENRALEKLTDVSVNVPIPLKFSQVVRVRSIRVIVSLHRALHDERERV